MDIQTREREQTFVSSTGTTTKSSTTSTSSASSSIRARARAYAREQIAHAYMDCLGRDIPRYCQVIVDEMLDDGIEAAVICYGLHEAAKAPSPSWRYAAAVIARCIRDGIRTAADLAAQHQARPSAATGWPQARKVREQMYTQRDYPETDELPAWMQARIRELHPD